VPFRNIGVEHGPHLIVAGRLVHRELTSGGAIPLFLGQSGGGFNDMASFGGVARLDHDLDGGELQGRAQQLEIQTSVTTPR